MKIVKIVLLIVAVSAFTPSFSQKITKKVTKEICACMQTLDKTLPPATLEQESENCFVQSMVGNIDGLIKEYKIDEDNEEATEKMSQDIAMRLLKECPTAVEIFMLIGESEDKPAEEEVPKEDK